MPNNIEPLTITQNGTYTAEPGHGYSPITVDIPGWTTDEIAGRTYLTGDLVVPLATSIRSYAFDHATNITSFSAPNVTTMGAGVFSGCSNLVSINLPSLTTITGQYPFEACSKLEKINLPLLTRTAGGTASASYVHRSCTKLKYLILPSYTYEEGSTGYQGNSSLEIIDNGVGNLNIQGLPSCPLHTIILRKTTGRQALNSGALNYSTAFKNGGTGGTVYIPEALYSHLGDGSSLDYKVATNWSVYNGYGTITWAKLEGSQYESIYWGNNI